MKHSRTLTERSTSFSDICQKFRTIFCKIAIISLGRNKPNNNSFSMLQTNKLKRSLGAVAEVYLFRTWAINLYMGGAAFGVSTIC